jgi:hypothetical protein
MLLKLILPLFVFIGAIQDLSAQNKNGTNLNALSFEIGKNGLIFNLGYDRYIKEDKLGLRFFGGSNFNTYLNAKNFGLGVYALKGELNRFFEYGLDAGYFVVEENSDDQKIYSILFPQEPINTFLVNFNFGYRNTTKNGIFRIGISPGIIKTGVTPGAYVSYGLRF